MPSCSDLIDECQRILHGYGSSNDRVTPLTIDIGPDDTTFTVDATFGPSTGITPGIIEIDSEQMYVQSVNAVDNTITLANGFGRGYNDTAAVGHSAGARITSRPRFPRKDLFNQMNEVLGAVYPDLFGVLGWTGVVTHPNNTYTLDYTPGMIIDVQWQDTLGRWVRAKGYSIDPYDATVRLAYGPMIGRPLRILYAVEPNPFSTEEDDFHFTTNLPSSCSDVVMLGVVAKAIPALDLARTQNTSVEQATRSTQVPPGSGVRTSQYYMAAFKDRLNNEAVSLRKRYPVILRRTYL